MNAERPVFCIVHYVSGIILDLGETAVNKAYKNSCPHKNYFIDKGDR